MLVTVEIPSSDPSYEWFLHFLAEHQRAQALPLSLSDKNASVNSASKDSEGSGFSLGNLLAKFKPAPRELAVETRTTKTATGASVTDFLLVPGQGKHIINYDSTLLQVSRQRDSKRINIPSGTPFETLEITTLYAQRSVLSTILHESQRLALCRAEGKTTVYNSWGTEWRPFGSPQHKRPLESVILATGVKSQIMTDLHSFLQSAGWYRSRGIPYRRGYLFYGPPGTGKTSLVKAIAGELDHNICIVNLSERGLTDDRLNHLLSNLPERSLALLEDVDAAFATRQTTADDGYHGANVTFSGLLNALDGAASGEDRILVLTTNYPERLDPALLRPGRVDLKVEIGYATHEVVEGMWERFYGNEYEQLKRRFLQILTRGGVFESENKSVEAVTTGPRSTSSSGNKTLEGVSTAELQGLFLFFKEDPDGAVGAAENLVSASAATTKSFREKN
jgi:chaperone BCS1